jgi:hypothetical protein
VSTCRAASGRCDAIGVSCYDASDGEQVAIAGPGNIVYCCVDAASASEVAGTAMYGDQDGILDATAGNATKICGYIVASGTQITTNYVAKVLLV